VADRSLVPGTGVGGMLLSQTLQYETSHHQDPPIHLRKLGHLPDRQIPRSTRALEIPTTNIDSFPALAAHSSSDPGHMRVKLLQLC
jgi:hypothetical protein